MIRRSFCVLLLCGATALGGASGETTLAKAATPALVINEIMAANQTGLTDEDGAAEDWIEIYNPGRTAADLAGWSLSDDPTLPDEWVFPSRILGPGQYLVVFASGKDRKPPPGTNPLHTNFKLAASGEFLGLYSPGTPRVLVSGFSPQFPEQRNDISYGLDPAGQWRYFTTPTPGASNGFSTITGTVAPVHLSVPRGHFTQPFTLTLSSPTPGTQIRYTTNGSEPTLGSGFPYWDPLRVTNTLLLRAAAFRTNFLPSKTVTYSYLFNLPAAYRTLPILSLVTDPNNLTGPQGIMGISNVVQLADGTWVPRDATGYHNPSLHGLAWERPTSVEYIRPADHQGFQADCGIRIQGSDWQRPRTTPGSKFSFRLYFRGDYGPAELDYPMFPLTTVHTFDQIVLRAGFNEQGNPFIRDELTRRLSHDTGQVAAHGDFVILLLNGAVAPVSPYYNPTERVNKKFMQAHLGGGQDWDVVSPAFAQTADEPGVIDGDRQNFESLVNFVNTQPMTNVARYLDVGRWLDLTNFTDYLLLNVYCAMGDWPANNFRAGRDRTAGNPGSLWRFVVWDAEWAMGIYGRAVSINMFTNDGPGPDNGALASVAYSEIAQMYQRLYANLEFRLLWADRVHKHFFNGGALTDTNITARFTQMQSQLAGVIPSMTTDILTYWVPQRRSIVFGQLDQYGLMASSNAPFFSQPGGRVARGFQLAMVATNIGGTVYYTTDGSDPRVMFTGQVASNAAVYTGPLVLQQSQTVRARTRNGSRWSALAEAAFEVATLGIPLRITEIHYHPPEGRFCEFLELQNVGSAVVDLSGMSFEGIDFTFPEGATLAAGARLVLASDNYPAGFASRYPGVAVAGWYGGALDNAGERIALKDRYGNIITSVTYGNGGGWPAAADGAGPSLEVINPLGDPNDPANWRASAATGGSPGGAGSAPPPPEVRLNEMMAFNVSAVTNSGTFPDWIELYNAGADSANLEGWSLSDDGEARKFVFPAGTTLAAQGYLVVWCDAGTNTTPGLHTGFALERHGGHVYLYDAATNRVDALGYGLQVADYSVGRMGDTWALTIPTPGAPNTQAATASATNLALNEWMANPAPGDPDWIELYNRSATRPVALNGLWLSTSNSVWQVTSLSFVPPGGFALLYADEGLGPDHLGFRLPASGTTLTLYDALAAQIDRVTYAAQTEGVSRGRLPDGGTNLVDFAGTASPGAGNYAATYTGPVLNEILARNLTAATNGASRPGFIELYNPNATAWGLGGMSVSVNTPQPGQWVFPPGTVLPAHEYLVVWCDGTRPASTNASDSNTGRWLDDASGGAYLFNGAGQLVNSVEYGFQVADRPIGLSGSQWRLLAAATPGAANASPASLGSNNLLRINEWMAQPAAGADWFELYNPGTLPVDLGGLILTDDPSVAGTNQFRVAPLSFIGPGSFTKWVADGDAGQGRNHVNFNLDAQGETLRLYGTNRATIIDSVSFGAQRLGVSEGRLPDGAPGMVNFPGSPTPGQPNYLLLPDVVINEVLPLASTPFEAAIELYNAGDAPAAVGGWFLSDSQDNLRQYCLPGGLVIPARGFTVLYENQFTQGGTNGLGLNWVLGGEIWLSEADSSGALTGRRTSAAFGAPENGVSFGPYSTAMGTDYVALTHPTFGVDEPDTVEGFRTGTGAGNAPVRVGPIVINEIMYHPPRGANGMDDPEFIELFNLADAPITLFDPAYPTNRWRLSSAVDFVFPQNVSIPAGGFVLVADFDPVADPAALARFRAGYSIPPNVPVFGPWAGRLNNAGESVRLLKPGSPLLPGSPAPGFVPWILVDRVDYGDGPPWPGGAVDGGGLSLQRRDPAAYGNDPENWIAARPTCGAANGAPVVNLPTIVQGPQSQSVPLGTTIVFDVSATGNEPLHFQWRFNGMELSDQTNANLVVDYAQLDNEGEYDVFVSSAGGSVFSAAAHLQVNALPTVLQPPQAAITQPGSNVVFAVTATGSAPLYYRWQHDGLDIPGATYSTLLLTNVDLANAGVYSVVISNRVGTATASASLAVLVKPAISQQPASQTVAVGETISLAVEATGQRPFSYRWRKNGLTFRWPGEAQLVMPNAALTNAGRYDVVVTNQANSILGGYTLSTNAFVLVVAPPASRSVLPGTNVTIRAIVCQPPLFTNRFLWLFNGAVLTAGTNPATSSQGFFTNDLLLPNISHAQEGLYTFLLSNPVTVTNIVVTTNPPATNYVVVTNFLGAPAAFTASIIIDSDGDGMPDWWETLYGFNPSDPADAAQDADGDGMTNLQEYLAGTNPRDAQSYLRMEADGAVAGGIILEFNAVSNRAYAVYCREAMSPVASWLKLQDISAAPVNRAIRLTNAPGTLERYYRLSIPSRP